jgi:2-keto-3-deoxy-L-rhamnonate aldolase RhmA
MPQSGTLRARILAREPMVAAFIPAPSPELIEIAAYGGFDFAVIDAEHGPISLGDIVHMVRAAQAARLPVMVRVPVVTKDFILRSLDAGADGILVPQVETEQEAAAAVAEAHYPPLGTRGAAYYARAHRFTRDTGWEALERANRQVITGVMIESRAGVSNIAAISRVPGVDFVLLGSTDLSVNIGQGPSNSSEVDAAVHEVSRTLAAAKKAAGISAPSVELAQTHRALGFQIIVTGLLPLALKEAMRFSEGARYRATAQSAT